MPCCGADGVPVWAIVYNVLSILLGLACTRVFKMPSWVTPAIAFNNTTSLPLLLVQSLDATGILEGLDGSSDVVARAKSYFLVNAMVSNSLTFALGPKLLNGQEEDAPNKPEKEDGPEDGRGGSANGHLQNDAEHGEAGDGGEDEGDDEDDERATEQSSLLPNSVARGARRAQKKGYRFGKHYFDRLPPWTQETLGFLYQFLNAPLIGAIIGAILGLVPPLHRAFFSESQDGGIFNAWLTSSVKNVGELFAALQVIVVGVKLSQAMRRMKHGEESGAVPWKPMVFVTVVRFVLWPLISIPLVWAMATRTSWLADDPILWFAMMLMPTGPPAMKLTALADVNGSDEREKMSIAKFLTVSSRGFGGTFSRGDALADRTMPDLVHPLPVDLLLRRGEPESVRGRRRVLSARRPRGREEHGSVGVVLLGLLLESARDRIEWGLERSRARGEIRFDVVPAMWLMSSLRDHVLLREPWPHTCWGPPGYEPGWAGIGILFTCCVWEVDARHASAVPHSPWLLSWWCYT